MITFSGKPVSQGIAFGKVWVYDKGEPLVKRRHIEDAEEEIKRYESARALATAELESLYYKATREIGEAEAQIFAIHKMMTEDVDFNESVANIIMKQKVNAETAVLQTAETFSKMFSEMEDSYMQARAADVIDISDRIIRILSGRPRDQNSSIILILKHQRSVWIHCIPGRFKGIALAQHKHCHYRSNSQQCNQAGTQCQYALFSAHTPETSFSIEYKAYFMYYNR